MSDICDKSFGLTMMKIADEYVRIKKIKFNSTTSKERIKEIETFMKTDEFKEYATKRIPEIVKETPIFTVAEFENGKIKSIREE